MELKDSPAEAEFRAQARAWLQDTLPRLGGPEPARLEDKLDYWRTWQRLLYDAGYAGLSWPKQYGGGGADAKLRAIFNEELDRAGAPERLNIIGEDFAGPTIIEFGTPAQQQRYLQPILTGDEIWCQLFSEPEAGSDLASLRTTATKVDGGWRIQGQKIWTSRAQLAAHAILLARTGGGPRHRGITYFLVAMDSPGVEIRPLAHMLGEPEFNEVFLDGVFIPDEGVLGEVDGGWRVAMGTLAFERVAIATGRVNTTGAVNDSDPPDLLSYNRRRHPAGRRPASAATDRGSVRARARALPDRAAGRYRSRRRRTAGPGDLDRETVLLPAGGGHRRFRTGARRDGRTVRARREVRLRHVTSRRPTLAAVGVSGPRHCDRGRVDVHPAQHRRRAHSRHAQELRPRAISGTRGRLAPYRFG